MAYNLHGSVDQHKIEGLWQYLSGEARNLHGTSGKGMVEVKTVRERIKQLEDFNRANAANAQMRGTQKGATRTNNNPKGGGKGNDGLNQQIPGKRRTKGEPGWQ